MIKKRILPRILGRSQESNQLPSDSSKEIPLSTDGITRREFVHEGERIGSRRKSLPGHDRQYTD